MRSRFLATIALTVLLAFGSLALAGCGGSDKSDEGAEPAATEQSAEPSTDAGTTDKDAGDDAEQDNCYGDDLPVTNE